MIPQIRERSQALTARSVSQVVESTPPVEQAAAIPSAPPVHRIKVSKTSDVKRIAGKIAHCGREGGLPDVACVGPNCINLAVKAIIVSRSYLVNDNVDISFQPLYQRLGRIKDDKFLTGIVLKLAKSEAPAPLPAEAPVTVSIGSKTKPELSAAAVANRVREQRAVVVVAIGVGAVQAAVLTLHKARNYLRRDLKDLWVRPEFTTVKKDDRELVAIEFHLMVHDLPPEQTAAATPAPEATAAVESAPAAEGSSS